MVLPRQDGPNPYLDTSGGSAHLADVDGHNAVAEVIEAARHEVSVAIGREVLLTRSLRDRLHPTCRERILEHGAASAQAMMVDDLLSQIGQLQRFNESERDRKVAVAFPSGQPGAPGPSDRATETPPPEGGQLPSPWAGAGGRANATEPFVIDRGINDDWLQQMRDPKWKPRDEPTPQGQKEEETPSSRTYAGGISLGPPLPQQPPK